LAASNIQSKLGPILSNHPIGPFGIIFLILGIVLIAGAGSVFLYALSLHFDPGFSPFLTLASIAGVLGIALVLRWLRYRAACVQVGENGFLLTLNGRQSLILWSEIAYITQRTQKMNANGLPTPKNARITVKTNNGKRFVFKNYQELEKLARVLQQQMSHQLLQHFIQSIKQGETIFFGALKIYSEGMSTWFRQLS
jgi:hypothetical protein